MLAHEWRTNDLAGPFGDGLDPTNRWLRLSQLIPWDEIDRYYGSQFDSARGGPHVLPARVAFGSLIIKERLGLTDIETVEMIQENPISRSFWDTAAFLPSVHLIHRSWFTFVNVSPLRICNPSMSY